MNCNYKKDGNMHVRSDEYKGQAWSDEDDEHKMQNSSHGLRKSHSKCN